MARVAFTRDFQKMLKGLAKSGKMGQLVARKAEAACSQVQLYGEIQLARTKHGESRLDCEKYDLGDGYRLVIQRAGSGEDAEIVMLFVGAHDESDLWLGRHKNYRWVKRESDGKIDFIQVTSSDGEVPAAHIEISVETPDHILDEPLLERFTDEELLRAGLSSERVQHLRKVTKGVWGETSASILDEIEKKDGINFALLVLDVFSMCDHGDIEGARHRLRLSASEASEATSEELAKAISNPLNSEEFYTWDEEEGMPPPSDSEEWMLYLHPDQAKIAFAELSGPTRLRGVSGSGKTCVLVHRARYLAKKYNEPVLLVSLTESMRKLLEALVIALCGPERSLIRVATVSSIAKDIIRDMHPEGERWYTLSSQEIADDAMKVAANAVHDAMSNTSQAIGRLDSLKLMKFLDEEFSFVRTRLLKGEYDNYTLPSFSRTGRKQALAESARHAVLKGMLAYEKLLQDMNRLDYEGVAQVAVEVLQARGERSDKFRWRAVLADEVQDLSQNEIRLIANIRTPDGTLLKTAADGIFLVGDGAQTIYKRGFSLKSLGIQLARSIVFKKNYRNTYEILQAAYGLIQNHEFADTDEDNRQKPLAPDFAARRGDRPVLVRCRGISGEVGYALEIIEGIRGAYGNRMLSDICVISRVPPIREGLVRRLKAKGIPCLNIKDNVSLNSPGVRISTIESAKGFEFGTVIIAGVSEAIGQVDSENEVAADPGADVAKLYVAMTRARDSLHITYTSNEDRMAAGELSSISKWCDEARFEGNEILPMRGVGAE